MTELRQYMRDLERIQIEADDALHVELCRRMGNEQYEAWAHAHLSSLHEWRKAGRALLDELILAEALQATIPVPEESQHA